MTEPYNRTNSIAVLRQCLSDSKQNVERIEKLILRLGGSIHKLPVPSPPMDHPVEKKPGKQLSITDV